MSSPTARRSSQRNSTSGTPRSSGRRSTQNPSSPPAPSSPTAGPSSQASALNQPFQPSSPQQASQSFSRRQAGASNGARQSTSGVARTNGNGVRSSSPLIYQSSSVMGSIDRNLMADDERMSVDRAEEGDEDEDGQRTPRASSRARIAAGESSPIRYVSSSSPRRVSNRAAHPRSGAPHTGSSDGLFLRSDGSEAAAFRLTGMARRGDIHPDAVIGTPGKRRQIFVDENGQPISHESDAPTFSQLDAATSDAAAAGGNSSRFIWGTNVSVQDSMSTFREFLLNFKKKYRLWSEGATKEDTDQNSEEAEEKVYINRLGEMRKLGVTSLMLDCKDLKVYPRTKKLWFQLQAYPQEIIPIMDQTIKDVMVDLVIDEIEKKRSQNQRASNQARTDPASSQPVFPSSERSNQTVTNSTGANQANGDPAADQALIDQVEDNIYKVRPFGLDATINLRELNPGDMDKLISIKGLVIRTTPIIPDMKEAFFRCQVCHHTVAIEIDRGKISEPTMCPRNICKSPNSMQIVHNRCGFADKQVIKLQETPDAIPDGQTPHSVSLCCYDELVDICKAGDRVEVTGIFRSNPVRINPRQRVIKSLFKTYVDVVHIQKVDKRRMGIDVSTLEEEILEEHSNLDQTRKVSEEEEQKIKAVSRRADVYDLLARSLAPSVWELDDIKKGILLQLFGGTNKSFQKGGNPRYRGDINILLCGDPSTSKSQILQYVHKIAPRGVYTSGKGSSAVGLTAYVTRDPETRQLVLESGALVLSDGGVCCIDEFDKMSDATRSVLHEVMEQQTVSIAKAGIITTLNARTSVLASANPIGSRFNPKLSIPANIDIPPPLLSRFDLVYLVLDRVDERDDRRLARHLVGMYLEDDMVNGAGDAEILPVEFLTSYISYAKSNIHPVLSEEASETLVQSYLSLRSLGSSGSGNDSNRRITATTRQLESLIRLSEALAKLHLSEVVTVEYVVEATRLLKSALKTAATDVRTGLIDMSLLTEGMSGSERKRRGDLRNAVLALLDEQGMSRSMGIRVADMLRQLQERERGVEGGELGDCLRGLEVEGLVSLIGEGARRTIKKVVGGG